MQATAQQLASLPSGWLASLISQMWLEEMYTANNDADDGYQGDTKAGKHWQQASLSTKTSW
jgi:hypothetical protein